MSTSVESAIRALRQAANDEAPPPVGQGQIDQLIEEIELAQSKGLSLNRISELLATALDLSPTTIKTYISIARRSRRDAQNLAAMKSASALIEPRQP